MEPIKAGYPLTTEIISTEIEVSQTPVRDALQKLAMLVARHCPEKREEAAAIAAGTLQKLQPRH